MKRESNDTCHSTAENGQVYFNINQAAKAAGVVPATIRNWEKEGLFTAKRKENNYRVFDFNDIQLLKEIKTCSTEKGMSMAVIKRLLLKDNLTSVPVYEKKAPKKIYHIKLKSCRENEGYTLEDVSSAVNISASYLSRIEQGQVNVSLDILERLAAFYGESTLSFFDVGHKQSSIVVKYGKGSPMETSLTGVQVESLGNSGNTAISPVRFLADVGCGDFKAHVHHSGEEFIYVLQGKLQVTLDEKETYILKEGDSIHFSSTRLHSWHNSGRKELDMIWVHSFL